MRKPSAAPLRRPEAGYTLLLALFVAAVMIIAASAAIPDLITQDRRQKEKLMIWRGEQYARAIGLYYRKTGHFPHDLEELEKGVNGIHFLRQAYKDPMNSQDGSWRLIYLGQGGQLMGSLCWQTLAEYEAAREGVPYLGPAPGGLEVTTGAPMAVGTAVATGKPTKPAVPTCAMLGQGPSETSSPQIITEGGMIGGNLIGVAGRVDVPSIKKYMGAGNYRYWEFIWDPQQGVQKLFPAGAPPAGLGPPGAPKTPTQLGGPTPPAPAPTTSGPGNSQSPIP